MSNGGDFCNPVTNALLAEFTDCLLEYRAKTYKTCCRDFVDPENIEKADISFCLGRVYNVAEKFEYAE